LAWKKQSSQLTFFAARFAGRLLCLVVGTAAIKAPLAAAHKARREGFPQIAEKTIPTRKRLRVSRYLVTI
jgi:hypothetical protein